MLDFDLSYDFPILYYKNVLWENNLTKSCHLITWYILSGNWVYYYNKSNRNYLSFRVNSHALISFPYILTKWQCLDFFILFILLHLRIMDITMWFIWTNFRHLWTMSNSFTPAETILYSSGKIYKLFLCVRIIRIKPLSTGV